MKEFKMYDGNMLEVGDDENDMPMIADFEILEKDEENLVRSLVKITDIR